MLTRSCCRFKARSQCDHYVYVTIMRIPDSQALIYKFQVGVEDLPRRHRLTERIVHVGVSAGDSLDAGNYVFAATTTCAVRAHRGTLSV